MTPILVFGSEDFSFDNGAIQLIGFLTKQLPGCTIYQLLRPEQLLDFAGKDVIILDAATGIDTPTLITDIRSIRYGRKVTAHDMDLGSFLSILHEVGQLGKVSIVAVPNDQNPNIFKGHALALIKTLIG